MCSASQILSELIVPLRFRCRRFDRREHQRSNQGKNSQSYGELNSFGILSQQPPTDIKRLQKENNQPHQHKTVMKGCFYWAVDQRVVWTSLGRAEVRAPPPDVLMEPLSFSTSPEGMSSSASSAGLILPFLSSLPTIVAAP